MDAMDIVKTVISDLLQRHPSGVLIAEVVDALKRAGKWDKATQAAVNETIRNPAVFEVGDGPAPEHPDTRTSKYAARIDGEGPTPPRTS